MRREALFLTFILCFVSIPDSYGKKRLRNRESFDLRRGKFTFGNWTQFHNYFQTDIEGNTETFDFNPYLGFGLEFTLPAPWYLSTEIGGTLPKTMADGAGTFNIFYLRADAIYRANRWKFLIGSSIVMSVFKGTGGTTTLSNGGTPTTFYRPELTQTALNNTFDLGIEYHFSKKWSARFQTLTYSLFDEDQRQISYTLSANIYFSAKK